MSPENMTKIAEMAQKIANKRNQPIAVFMINNTYYFLNANTLSAENGKEFGGEYIIRLEPNLSNNYGKSAQLFYNI